MWWLSPTIDYFDHVATFQVTLSGDTLTNPGPIQKWWCQVWEDYTKQRLQHRKCYKDVGSELTPQQVNNVHSP